jgi:hypothetical protein
MSGEIRKVPQTRREMVKQPKIIGAQPRQEGRAPKILDHNTKQKPVQIEIKKHGERVTIKEHTRAKPRKRKDPDVRLQLMSKEQREAWNDVKHSKWEPE